MNFKKRFLISIFEIIETNKCMLRVITTFVTVLHLYALHILLQVLLTFIIFWFYGFLVQFWSGDKKCIRVFLIWILTTFFTGNVVKYFATLLGSLKNTQNEKYCKFKQQVRVSFLSPDLLSHLLIYPCYYTEI